MGLGFEKVDVIDPPGTRLTLHMLLERDNALSAVEPTEALKS